MQEIGAYPGALEPAIGDEPLALAFRDGAPSPGDIQRKRCRCLDD
jgi:hypothetical protein